MGSDSVSDFDDRFGDSEILPRGAGLIEEFRNRHELPSRQPDCFRCIYKPSASKPFACIRHAVDKDVRSGDVVTRRSSTHAASRELDMRMLGDFLDATASSLCILSVW
jgi:hypothetical protein